MTKVVVGNVVRDCLFCWLANSDDDLCQNVCVLVYEMMDAIWYNNVLLLNNNVNDKKLNKMYYLMIFYFES